MTNYILNNLNNNLNGLNNILNDLNNILNDLNDNFNNLIIIEMVQMMIKTTYNNLNSLMMV